jgi:hypothetical protein
MSKNSAATLHVSRAMLLNRGLIPLCVPEVRPRRKRLNRRGCRSGVHDRVDSTPLPASPETPTRASPTKPAATAATTLAAFLAQAEKAQHADAGVDETGDEEGIVRETGQGGTR